MNVRRTVPSRRSSHARNLSTRVIEVELFVAVLGASSYTFAEATYTQRSTLSTSASPPRIGISVWHRSAWTRRIPDRATLQRAVAAWQKARNAAGARIRTGDGSPCDGRILVFRRHSKRKSKEPSGIWPFRNVDARFRSLPTGMAQGLIASLIQAP